MARHKNYPKGRTLPRDNAESLNGLLPIAAKDLICNVQNVSKTMFVAPEVFTGSKLSIIIYGSEMCNAEMKKKRIVYFVSKWNAMVIALQLLLFNRSKNFTATRSTLLMIFILCAYLRWTASSCPGAASPYSKKQAKATKIYDMKQNKR